MSKRPQPTPRAGNRPLTSPSQPARPPSTRQAQGRRTPLVALGAAFVVIVAIGIGLLISNGQPRPTTPPSSGGAPGPGATGTQASTGNAPALAAGSHSVAGPGVDMQWGTVQVTLIVRNKKVVDVQATAPMERARSADINSQALPLLREEVLQAQSANIDLLSGATLTSEAYQQSLQAALASANM